MPRRSRHAVRGIIAWAPAVAALSVLASLWLPWVQTGTTVRSAFRVVSALRGAGLMSRTPAELFFASIAVLPGLVAVAWLLGGTGYRRASAAAAAIAGALTVASTLAVRQVAHRRATSALALATAAGAVVLGLSIAALAADGWTDRGKATT
jgi:hypothetical protein